MSSITIPIPSTDATRTEPGHRSLLREAWPVASLCAGINFILFVAIALQNPSYLSDYRLNNLSDARHYVLLGRNYLLQGEYSRCNEPPYVPDYLRTPVYPLFAGALEIVGNVALLYFVQALLHVASCVLLYGILRSRWGRGAATCASLFLATDLMLAISNFEAMSEPLFLFLTLAGVGCFLKVLLSEKPPISWGWLVAGGGLFALASLARPAGLYVPFLLAALLAVQVLWRRQLRLVGPALVLFLFVSLIPVGGWMARNKAVFGVARLTHNDAIMLVYFTGAGAYQLEHDLTLTEAHDRISQDYNLPHPEVTNNHWTSTQSVADMDRDLRAAIRPILLKNPTAVAESCLRGSIKATVSHNAVAFAPILGKEWIAPSAAAIARGDRAALERLAANDPWLSASFLWQMLHLIVTWLLVPLGVYWALRDARQRPIALCFLLLLAYFYLTVAMVGLEAFHRSRTPHLPYLYAFAGLALWHVGSGIARRWSRRAPGLAGAS